MFGVDALAAGVLTGFLSSILTGSVNHFVSKIWDDDKQIRELRDQLDKYLETLKLTKSLKNDDHIHSELPPDWLDELERCRYDIEDIEESMELEFKKEFLTKFLNTYIRYVKLLIDKGEKEKHAMEGGQLDSMNSERQAYELLDSRKQCKSKIIKELTSTTNRFGVSIIGMGGIGKTILAKAIAAEAKDNKTYFPIIFTPKSPKFNVEIALAHSESNKPPSKDVRVLILLDGMHWVNPEDWDKFRSQCREILHPESKYLITTQNPRVADVTGTSKYFMHPLEGKECFSFIYNLASGNRNLCEEDDVAIKQYERELVDTSKGLPLLASQIGVLLAAEAQGNRKSKITEITGRNSWEVEGLKRVLSKLELVSLLAQNTNLRRCLAYCSLFPPDHEFEQDDLVQFWMAEGFTQPSIDKTWMEDITKRYFDELLSCSLFQISSSMPGEKPRYKLHKLSYDMALNVASKTFCQKHICKSNSTLEISDITRHISLSCKNIGEIDIDQLLSNLHISCSSLRTFLFVERSGEKIKKNPTFFKRLTRLRVLDLRYTNLTKLDPKYISNLTYLRYLDLSYTRVQKLPTLSKSLQVLKLCPCTSLRDLNNDLTQLTNLISLEVNATLLTSLPSGIGKLINLQRLDVFIVGKSNGFKITELGDLNNLRKSLHIKQLENVESKQEAKGAMLRSKHYLDRLELEWSTSAPNDTAEQVLKGLQPPKSLTELMIRNYCGTKFPKWLSDGQVCGLLKSIHLKSCRALPLVDHLSLLKTLRLEAMHMINHGTARFPFIETLVLCNMAHLDSWIDFAARCMPSLLILRVDKCQELVELPQLNNLKSLQKLEIIWCTMLEGLPTMPPSLKSLIIESSDNLEERCQIEGADRPKIRGIQVFINSVPVDTSEPDPAASGHQSSRIQETSNEHQNTSSHLQCTTSVVGGSNSAVSWRSWFQEWLPR